MALNAMVVFFFFFQVAPTSSKQHGVNVGVNASATPFQQASGYGSHGYSTGETLYRTKMSCLEGHAGPALYTCITITVLILTMWPLISHRRGVRISFEPCSMYKHKHDACVKTFVLLLSKQ